METQIQIRNPLSDPGWDDLLAACPQATFFHGRAWAQVLYETYHYPLVYFCTQQGNAIRSLLPAMEVKSILTGTRGVSLPFTDYCDPILQEEDGDWPRFFEHVSRYGQQHRWQSFQFRGGDGIPAPAEQQYYLHELPLETDTDVQFAKLCPAKRRNIRKALTQDVEILHTDDLAGLDAYYHLHCQTRKRHGTPPQPYRFFHNIFKYIIAAGQGKIILAQYQNRVIAGCVYFHFQKKAIYKFGASDMAFQHLRPSDLVMWEAIRWYAANHYQAFCFGRTAMDNDGLRRFKADWGAQEKTISYYRYNLRRQNFVTAPSTEESKHKRLFQCLPLPALKCVGALAYRHMG